MCILFGKCVCLIRGKDTFFFSMQAIENNPDLHASQHTVGPRDGRNGKRAGVHFFYTTV
jgi:hypothetical protein